MRKVPVRLWKRAEMGTRRSFRVDAVKLLVCCINFCCLSSWETGRLLVSEHKYHLPVSIEVRWLFRELDISPYRALLSGVEEGEKARQILELAEPSVEGSLLSWQPGGSFSLGGPLTQVSLSPKILSGWEPYRFFWFSENSRPRLIRSVERQGDPPG